MSVEKELSRRDRVKRVKLANVMKMTLRRLRFQAACARLLS